jgi:HlyD family secretion protein
MSRRIAFTIALAGALGVAGGVAALGGGPFARRKPHFHIEKAHVERGDVIGKVTATGTLSALVTVQVGSQVSGRIAELDADFGSRVRKGQVIARLDAQLFAAAAEQSRANRDAAAGKLAQSRAKAENAERQLQRARELAAKKLIADADLDDKVARAASSQAAVQAAEGDLAQARAAYHQATVNLGYTTIVSPIDGVVISRNVDVGQTVAASLQAPTLFTIAEDLRKMQVHTAVSEADVGRLAPDMPATFAVDAFPDERFHGVIRQIRDAPQTLQNVVTYDAVVEVDNPRQQLKPGMTANVTFIYAERKGVLHIPTAALRFRPPPELLALAAAGPGAPPVHLETHKKKHKSADGQASGGPALPAVPDAGPRRSVWVMRDDRLVEVGVALGVADGSRVEITAGGLHEGDAVIVDAISPAERAEMKAEGKKAKGIF